MTCAAVSLLLGESPLRFLPVALLASVAVVIERVVEPQEPTLGEVVLSAQAGDERAFDELYRRFARTVHGIALARVGVQDAEDLTQEVFLVVHRGLARLRDPGSLASWICKVARNQATDWLRRAQRRPTRESLSDEQVVDDRIAGGELEQRVLACIRGLPAAYGETLVLRLVEGLTGPEIAERTGLTPGSVRVNLCRGMSMLRPLLEKEGWR